MKSPFNTRSLSDQFRRLINNFTIAQAQEEPDWSRVHVLASWGSGGGEARDGIYRKYCAANELPFRDFGSAKSRYGSADAFAGACREALGEGRPVPIYDAILVDEAQDLPPEFLRMCYDLLGPKKRLVYAYDELQTLTGTGLPPAEVIFGSDPETNIPLVRFDPEAPDIERRDIILQKCYRNSRPVLVTAHALGFGVYRQPPPNRTTGLVQMFENKELWSDIGYRVAEGVLEDDNNVTLARTSDSSPSWLEGHSAVDDLIQFVRFNNANEQNQWIADQIQRNLTDDELVANDIIVINPDPFTTRNNVGPLRAELFDRGVTTHLAGVDTATDVFFRRDEQSVTFTGIYRAKGNEAGMVYVANAHESMASSVSVSSMRNRLFTAITRSKGWVRVTGVGDDMDRLVSEYEQIKQHDFTLAFRYPTESERNKLQVIHRDMSRAVVSKVRRADRTLASLIQDFEDGEIYPDDLDPQTLARLASLLDRANENPDGPNRPSPQD